ncbi:hypothetical protein N8972_01245, partial [Sulfurospirillum sp.]|nr:hypothetical protein [Sulfurospirillum sp.]
WHGELWDLKDDTEYAKRPLANQVKFKAPNGTYQNITADEHYWFTVKRSSGNNGDMKWRNKSRYEMHYQGYKNVTNIVKNAGNGNYWLADIQATLGKLHYPGVEAAWNLQVIYEDPAGKARSISITDGYYGLYGNGISGDDYANEINALYGTNCKTGGENTGAYDYKISFDVGGFLTPKKSGFETDMSIFLTESDPETGYTVNLPEELSLTKTYGTKTTVDGPSLGETDAWAYQITNKDGTDNRDRTPSYIYPIGVTIKNYKKTDLLDTKQTSTKVTFKTDNDRLILGVIGFATDLRKPNLCYDYSYSQYNQYFTEEYNSLFGPQITGPVDVNEPIKVKLYLRNTENSDITADSVKMNILDINTTQATYNPESLSIVYPGSIYTTDIPDSLFDIDSNLSNIENIPAAQIKGSEHIYLYYSIDPLMPTLNMPINARVDYDITLPISPTKDITIPYKVTLNKNVPICNSDNSYIPVRGRFNVVHNNFYTGSDTYYNIPTQITKREGDFKVLSHDPDNLDDLMPLPYSTWVAVDIIDASAFHDTTASCEEKSSAVSKKVWIELEKDKTSSIFNKAAIQNAVAQGQTELLTSSELYNNATKNAAFRVSYNSDANGSLVQTKRIIKNGEVKYAVENFNELAQGLEEYNDPKSNKCVVPVTVGNKTYKTMPEACGNASMTNGVTAAQLTICMQCVYGVNTKFYCSRDNFSIRPDTFKMTLNDQNQSNPTTKQHIIDNENTLGTTTTTRSKIASGYQYNIDLIATNFIDNNKAIGYTQQFVNSTDTNITYIWEPSSVVTCNDTTNKNISTLMIDGAIDLNTSINQVGEYRLNMIDTSWTKYDSNPKYMKHHDSNPSYFKPSSIPDCTPNSSNTEALGSSTLNGCNINSTHDSNNTSYTYQDLLFTSKPYRFNIDSTTPLIFSQGADFNTTLNSFIYTANVNDVNSQPMSLHVIGNIVPEGYDGVSTLSNYVGGCYADNIDLTLNRTMLDPIIEPYQARFIDRNTTSVVTDITREVNATNILFSLTEGNFTFDNNGILPMELHLNFSRQINQAQEPTRVQLSNFDINCTTPTNCQFSADFKTNQKANATRNLNDANLTHYYGRVHAPDYKFNVNPGNANIFYEVYCETCTQALYDINSIESSDSIYWYQNENHNAANDGNVVPFGNFSSLAGTITSVPNTPINQGVENIRFTSNVVPNKDRIQMTPSPWLLYNRFSENARTNDFIVEFFKANSNWAGEGSLGDIIDLNVSTIQNRRLDW